MLKDDPWGYKSPPIINPNYAALLATKMQFGPNAEKVIPDPTKLIPKFQPYSYFNTPFFIINGGLDKLVDPRVGFDLINTTPNVPNDKKELYFQDDMWHNIWFDRRIMKDIMPKVLSFIKRIG
jgi:hypothetical protein